MNKNAKRVLEILRQCYASEDDYVCGRSLREELNRGRWWICKVSRRGFCRMMADLEDSNLIIRKHRQGQSYFKLRISKQERQRMQVNRTQQLIGYLLDSVPDEFSRYPISIAYDVGNPRLETAAVWVETPDGPLTLKEPLKTKRD